MPHALLRWSESRVLSLLLIPQIPTRCLGWCVWCLVSGVCCHAGLMCYGLYVSVANNSLTGYVPQSLTRFGPQAFDLNCLNDCGYTRQVSLFRRRASTFKLQKRRCPSFRLFWCRQTGFLFALP